MGWKTRMFILIYWIISYMLLQSLVTQGHPNRIVLGISPQNVQVVTEIAKKYSLKYVRKIVSDFYLFKTGEIPVTLNSTWMVFRNELREKINYYKEEFPSHRRHPHDESYFLAMGDGRKGHGDKDDMGGFDFDIYGMGVANAWRAGYTGNGIYVAVVDVGLDIDVDDLNGKIVADLSFDYIDNKKGASLPQRWQMNYPDFIEQYKNCPHHQLNSILFLILLLTTLFGTNILLLSHNYNVHGFTRFADVWIRMTDPTGIYDDAIASALIHEKDIIQIYSMSWGADDDTCGFDQLSPYVQESLRIGVEQGRKCKGSLYVVPAGNGNVTDNCNADGYANSIYTITIGSVSYDGSIPFFAEPCPCTLAATFGIGSNFNYSILETTSVNNSCEDFRGSSASVSLASGILAILLENKPALTRRDVVHIIVNSAKTDGLDNDTFVVNGVGRLVSPYFGFGLMDADGMIQVAKTWKPVPEEHVCSYTFNSLTKKIKISQGKARTKHQIDISTTGCHNEINEIISLEYVQLDVEFNVTDLSSIEVTLQSPMNTNCEMITKRRRYCKQFSGRQMTWTFTSVFFWDENPNGVWNIVFQSKSAIQNESINLVISNLTLRLYGTGNKLKASPPLYQCIPATDIEAVTEAIPSKQHGSSNNYTITIIVTVSVVLVVAIIIGVIIKKYKGDFRCCTRGLTDNSKTTEYNPIYQNDDISTQTADSSV